MNGKGDECYGWKKRRRESSTRGNDEVVYDGLPDNMTFSIQKVII